MFRSHFFLSSFFLSLCFSLFAEEPKDVLLWPGDAPGEVEGEVGEETEEVKGVKRVRNVTKPSITFFWADQQKANGITVIVCPGGAYQILAIEHEGEDVCKWLNSLGIHAALLKYRVPRRKNREPHAAPLQDAQRAMRLVRQAGKSWEVPLTKLGIIGFSAGGNLALRTATSFEEPTYEPIDPADQLSCRPDFALLLYPAYLTLKDDRTVLDPSIEMTSNCPPMFFAHTGDDHIPAEGSVLAYLALEQAGVEGSEIHIFPYGGHGYGLRQSRYPVSQWPNLASTWLVSLKMIEK